jgi:hypothetical protein
MITVCAIISGAGSWTPVTEKGPSKFHWFTELPELPNGILCRDTSGLLSAKIDLRGFQDFCVPGPGAF